MYIPKRTEDDVGRVARLRAAEDDFGDLDIEEVEEESEFLKLRENLERMEEAGVMYSEKARDLTQRLLTAQNPSVIDRNALKYVAAIQRERFFGCLSLPFSFFVFLLFAASASLHEDITNTYMIESGLRGELGDGIDGAEDVEGVWNFILDTFLPKAFLQLDIFGQPLQDKKDWSRVLMFNQVTGPVVLEQLRGKKELCFDGEGFMGEMACYPEKSIDKEPIKGRTVKNWQALVGIPDVSEYKQWQQNASMVPTREARRAYYETAFVAQKDDEDIEAAATSRRLFSGLGRRLRIARSEYLGRLPGGRPDNDAFNAYLSPNTPFAQLEEHVKYLKARGWLDAQTKQLSIKTLLLNSEVGRPRLEQVNILFRFSRGGGVFARLTMESLFLKSHDGGPSLAADGLFMIILLILTLLLADKLIKAWRAKELKKTLGRGMVILELFIIFFGWITMLGYVIQGNMRRHVVDAMKENIDVSGAKGDFAPETSKASKLLLNKADDMTFFTSYFRLLQAGYHLFLMLRFFTAFRAQPRLGVITETLRASVVDIFHFIIVLVPTFLAYCISACFIFGRRMEPYSTFDASIGMCFKMLMEGEYDWDALSEEHYWTAAFWVWTFMLLLVVIMMNMVLAIVMDIYSDRRKNAGESEAVWTTLYNLWLRIYHARSWVSNRELLEKAENMERLLDRDQLITYFPTISEQQLGALIAACRYQAEQDSTQDMSTEDSMRMTMAIKLAIDQVNEDMVALQEGTFKEYDKNIFNENGWLQDVSRQMATHNHWMLSLQWQLQQLQWQWGSVEAVHGSDARLNKGAKPWQEDDPADVVI